MAGYELRLIEWLEARRALPDAPVFAMGYWQVTEALNRALAAVGMKDYRSHDWRHTYAVQALRDGVTPQVVAHQLGHKTPAMVYAVYGRYAPTASDYRSRLTVGLTVDSQSNANTARKRVAI